MYSTEGHYCMKKFLILINVKNKMVDFFYSEESICLLQVYKYLHIQVLIKLSNEQHFLYNNLNLVYSFTDGIVNFIYRSDKLIFKNILRRKK